MVIMLPGNNDEARFGHLLQPIRDLTKNWQVDIATQLEDYLTEIEVVRISFDGGATSMNFAEAALLIQGSTCIYSKKVEFLYALVFQTLDVLASKKKMQQAVSVDAEGRDADVTFAFDKSRAAFLTLDDIPQAKNVNIKGTAKDNIDKSIAVILRTPLSVGKMDELDRGTPLLNARSETVGFAKDFKLNTVFFHGSGVLLQEPVHYSVLEQSLLRHPASTPMVPRKDVDLKEDEDDNLIPEIPEDDDNQPPLNTSLDDVEMGDPFGELNNSLENVKEEIGRAGLRPRQPLRPIQAKEEHKDPWETMDPDEVVTEKEKPFKKGRCFKLPPSLATAKARKRKRNIVKKPLAPLDEFINNTYFSHSSKLPANPFKIPSCPEFENAFWVVYKKHEANLRKEKALLMKQGKAESEVDEYLQEEPVPPAAGVFPGTEPDDFDEGDDGGGPLDGFDDGEADGIAGGMDEHPDVFSQNSANELVTDYENLVKQYVDDYMASAQEYAQVTELSKRVQQWEDKLGPILKREEEHGFFDIHDYGTLVIQRLDECSKTKKDPISFSEVVSEKNNFDISRMFLATLQLVFNVKLSVTS
ncbi:putative condensin-2 complex subunit H2 isoform X3 [Apostichopus japonicus]|uniref:Putative condensin-2 complex subunit H2 isoform X3 n=1 Tax=Stichopus japonicus TaxID=307972 RepID=A0A2G8JXY2_STIJA|nr:putative condensin-2 complex subunit H2 isoform X3 [Apostichopus japonicus]